MPIHVDTEGRITVLAPGPSPVVRFVAVEVTDGLVAGSGETESQARETAAAYLAELVAEEIEEGDAPGPVVLEVARVEGPARAVRALLAELGV